MCGDLMNVREIKISNSARLFAVQTDKFKKNLLTMSFFVPISNKTLAADMLFPKILLRGCKKYPDNASVKRRLEELYASTISVRRSYYGDYYMTGYAAEFLDDKIVGSYNEIFDGILDILSEIWINPNTDEDGMLRKSEIEREKSVLCDTIRAKINNTDSFAYSKCRELLCSGEPHGYSIQIDDVERVDRKSLDERYRFLRENGYITFFYVGTREPEVVASALSKAFSKSKAINSNEIFKLLPTSNNNELIFKSDSMPITQSKLVMGFTADGCVMNDTREYYAMCLMSEIFGGSPTSKLFSTVREKKGLCYYCNAYYDNFKGIIFVNCGIDAVKCDEVKKAILDQLEEIKSGNISEHEFKSAIAAIENSYMQITDSPYSIYSFGFDRSICNMSTSPEKFVDSIKKITIDDIKNAARRVKLKAVYFLEGKDQEMECDE